MRGRRSRSRKSKVPRKIIILIKYNKIRKVRREMRFIIRIILMLFAMPWFRVPFSIFQNLILFIFLRRRCCVECFPFPISLLFHVWTISMEFISFSSNFTNQRHCVVFV